MSKKNPFLIAFTQVVMTGYPAAACKNAMRSLMVALVNVVA